MFSGKNTKAGSFVSANEIADVFLPKQMTNISINNLFVILRLAKEGKYTLPPAASITQKQVGDLINAMDVYRCVLSIPSTAELLENGLLTLWLLSDANCPNTCTEIIRKSVELLERKPAQTSFDTLQACITYAFISRTFSIDAIDLTGDKSKYSNYYLQGNRDLLPLSYVSIFPPEDVSGKKSKKLKKSKKSNNNNNNMEGGNRRKTRKRY